jgi:hypothetical protein
VLPDSELVGTEGPAGLTQLHAVHGFSVRGKGTSIVAEITAARAMQGAFIPAL